MTASCDFIFYKSIAGHLLSEEETAELFNRGETRVITDFITRKGQAFSAKVVWDKDCKATFAFENDGHFHGTETRYKCPLCKHILEENKNAIFCTGKGTDRDEQGSPCDCKFTLFKTVAGKKLRSADIKALLCGEKTQTLSGFKSKKGESFDASLKLNNAGRIEFEFMHRDLPCPICADQLRFRSASDANGNNVSAYICMNNLCNYSIPKVFYQREFKDDEVEELLKKRLTPVLEVFKKNDTKFRAALEIQERGKLAFIKQTIEVIAKKT